ncbi:MAG: hypothetical protein ACRDKB_14510, partial [Actinomycetota bacterium]
MTLNRHLFSMRTRASVAVIAVAALALVLAAPASAGRPAAGGKGGKPRVVVAVVDTGINPYHEFFHAGG